MFTISSIGYKSLYQMI